MPSSVERTDNTSRATSSPFMDFANIDSRTNFCLMVHPEQYQTTTAKAYPNRDVPSNITDTSLPSNSLRMSSFSFLNIGGMKSARCEL